MIAAIFLTLCGGMFTLLLLGLILMLFVTPEEWDEINKYYEEKENSGGEFGDEHVGS